MYLMSENPGKAKKKLFHCESGCSLLKRFNQSCFDDGFIEHCYTLFHTKFLS